MEPDRPFEVVDHRRIRPDEPDGGEKTPDNEATSNVGESPDPAMTTAPADEETAADLPPMDVYGLLGTTVGLLANGAWAWLGLVPNPFSGKMERDFKQAKIAIDTVAFLVGQIEERLSDEERRDLHNLLANLRINYVQQVEANTAKG